MKFMSPERHEKLMKTAENCLGLVDIGVSPTEALSKLAADEGLNEHEVDLVTRAVNTARQLSHIQASAPGEKETAIELVDAEAVKSSLQPLTNGNAAKDDAIAGTDTLSQSAFDSMKQPDALDIFENLKTASAEDFRRRKAAPQFTELSKTASSLHETPAKEIFAYKLAALDVQLSEARTREFGARSECEGLITKLAYELNKTAAPSFADVRAVAEAMGVSEGILNLVQHGAGVSEGRGTLRKHASGKLISPENVHRLAELCVKVAAAINTASDIHAAIEVLEARRDSLDARFRKQAGWLPSVSVSAKDPGEMFSSALGAFDSDDEKVNASDILGRGGQGKTYDDDLEDVVMHAGLRQSVENKKRRVELQTLMMDPYISKHEPQLVIDAYNEGVAQYPDISETELKSFMRQYLSTEGAMPMDLMVKMRAKGMSV